MNLWAVPKLRLLCWLGRRRSCSIAMLSTSSSTSRQSTGGFGAGSFFSDIPGPSAQQDSLCLDKRNTANGLPMTCHRLSLISKPKTVSCIKISPSPSESSAASAPIHENTRASKAIFFKTRVSLRSVGCGCKQTSFSCRDNRTQ